MASERRAQLETQLAAEVARIAPGASPMEGVCSLAVSQLRVSGAGATVLALVGDGDGQGPRRGLVHATNAVSTELEQLQLTVGEGPCLDAFETGGPVLISDLAREDTRWPGFTPGAVQAGADAVFSFPLQIGVFRLGSLDCYRDQPGGLSQPQLTDGLILADLATQTVLSELDGHATEDTSWLADPYAEVHQAAGMAQVQLGTTNEAALLRLRAHAYTHELAVTEVAHQIVTRQLRLGPADEDDPQDDPQEDPA